MRIDSNLKDFNKQVDKLRNPAVYLSRIGEALLQATHERIQKTKVSPDGTPWAPWASSTARARRKAGTAGTGLLFNTGALDKSLTYSVQGPKVSVHSSSPYAQYLQNGTSRMPARPFLGIGKKEEALILDIWNKWLKE
jgi:phage virion morphogenesis protein